MAISNETLADFFLEQNNKIGNIDALRDTGKAKKNTQNKPLKNKHTSVSNPLANQPQSVSNPLAKESALNQANELINLSSFSDTEQKFLDILFWKCHNNCSLISPPVTTNEITNMLHISPVRVRNLIFRVSRKNGILVKAYKSGKNACRIFEFPEKIYQIMSVDHQRKIQNFSNPLAIPLAKNETSSSSNITTTTEKQKFSEDWNNIDATPLKHISFSQSQINQLKAETLNEENLNRSYITPKNIQTSIDRFAYTLKHNPAKVKTFKQDPLQVIFGVLKGGRVWTENKYESPDDIAAKKTLEALESDEKKRLQAQEERVNKISSLKFEVWKSELSETDIARIAPTSKVTNTSYDTSLDGLLIAHHKEIIRQEIKDASSRQSNTGEPISEN